MEDKRPGLDRSAMAPRTYPNTGKNSGGNLLSELAGSPRAVLPYWGWIAILVSLTALVVSAMIFADTGNPAVLVIAVVAGYLAYRLTR